MAQSINGVGVVILAAGRGTRMYSEQPKVLQRLLGEPMLEYVLRAVRGLGASEAAPLIVVGHGADAVRRAVGEEAGTFVLQAEQLGTGHALQTAWPDIKASGVEYVLVVNGDTPLVEAETLRAFALESLAAQLDLAFISLELPDPGAFGRVLRKNGKLAGIIEAKDYDASLHGPEPREINAGIYFLRVAAVEGLLSSLKPSGKSGELYITDLVELAVGNGFKAEAFCHGSDPRLLGINSPRELSEADELLRRRIVESWQDKGVLVYSPSSMRIGPQVALEPGVVLHGPGEIYGKSAIAAGVEIETHCFLRNAQIGGGTKMRSYCHIEDAVVGANCQVGPNSRLRPGAVMEDESHIGNFVEMKKARLGKGAKANHLTYLGDAEIGPGTNIGAGTITCNYDGKNKFKTVIGARAFIGSNTALVAPVTVGDNALIGAGSVITQDVPSDSLALARGRQVNKAKKK